MNSDNNFNTNTNTSSGHDNEGCKDIPNGFQDMDPNLFTLLGGVIGDLMAANLPLNLQNAIGNWLSLVGQAMMTFAAQQAYFESGPGRCYNKKNRNVTNPFCPNDTSNINGNSNGNSNSNENSKPQDIESLSSSVNNLLVEVDKLKKEIQELKNNKG